MKRFSRLTPHFRLNSNPVFAYEARRVPHAATAEALLRRGARSAGVLFLVVVLLWVAALALAYNSAERTSADVMQLLFMACGFTLLALDLFSLSKALGSLSEEFVAGRWDLLRLTALRPSQVIAAKFAASQLRVWNFTALVAGLRAATLLVSGTYLALRDAGRGIFPQLGDLPLYLALLGVGLLLILEPFLRMNAVTALGVAVSANPRSPTSGVLVAGVALAGFWLVQGLAALAFLILLAVVLSPLAAFEALALQQAICSPFAFLLVFGITLYGFYSVIQSWALRRAERTALRHDLFLS